MASPSQSTNGISTCCSDSEKGTMANQGHDPQLMEINETGHIQELERNFSLLSVCSVGIVTGNTWAALGGSIAVAIYNGGPPGVLYEFIAVSIFYWLVAASLAELASSIPSSAGVYHWASITPGPKYGRMCGWFAGWWNTFAWMFACASISSISGNIAVAIYGVFHPDYVPSVVHVFASYVVATWLCCGIVLLANRALPAINNIGLFFILAGVFITILVCAIMPYQSGSGYATSSFVWTDWSNQTGYTSNGFVFLAGMLNGAFAVGVPDCVSHLAEEIPRPRRNIPLAIGAQMVIGFITTFIYMIAIFYATNDLNEVLGAKYFPLAQIYAQATSSKGGTLGLLLLIFFPMICCLIGAYITAGRCLWTLARDDAVPFAKVLRPISPRFKNPFNATVTCGVFTTILGFILVGSNTAFNAIIGSFIILSTLSYLAAILPFIFTRRFSRVGEMSSLYNNNMRPGPYQMGSVVGYAVNIISCLYIVVFIVIYCFPYSMPVTPATMNYASLITGALSLFVLLWWFINSSNYVGPALGQPRSSIEALTQSPMAIEVAEVKVA